MVKQSGHFRSVRRGASASIRSGQSSCTTKSSSYRTCWPSWIRSPQAGHWLEYRAV